MSGSARLAVKVERRAGGILLLSAGRDLADDYPLLIDRLREAAERQPRAPFSAGRFSQAEAWVRSGAIASWLIAQGYGPDSRPAAVLSGDGVEPALFLLGAERAGLPVALLPRVIARFDEAMDLVRPALVFAPDSHVYSVTLDRACAGGAELVTADGKRGLAFAALANCSIDAAVAERRLHITGDTPARILFTSDPTGPMKAALNTHGNLAAAAEMTRDANAPAGAVWGMAETTGTGFVFGRPLPGLSAKLVPMDDGYELRLKGPNVMPGYYRDPEATRAAFDEDGFFKTGRPVRWVDPAAPQKGLALDTASSGLQPG